MVDMGDCIHSGDDMDNKDGMSYGGARGTGKTVYNNPEIQRLFDQCRDGKIPKGMSLGKFIRRFMEVNSSEEGLQEITEEAVKRNL